MSSTYSGSSAYPTSITLPDDGETIEAADVNVPLSGLADRTTYLLAGLLITSEVAADSTETYTVTTPRFVRVNSTITAARTKKLGASGPPIEGAVVRFAAESSLAFPVTITDQADAILFVLGNDGASDGTWVECVYASSAWRIRARSQGTLQRSQTFTSSGSLTVPRGVTRALVSGCGGGGGGGGGSTGTSTTAVYSPGGGGGESAPYSQVEMIVTPGETLNVVIGAGGAGGSGAAYPPTAGAAGTLSSVTGATSGSLVQFMGGGGGCAGVQLGTSSPGACVVPGGRGGLDGRGSLYVPQNQAAAPPFGGGGWGGCTASGLGLATSGAQTCVRAIGAGAVGAAGTTGTSGSSYEGGGGGGGGGAGPYGSGGAGGNGSNHNAAGNSSAGTAGTSAGANTGGGGGGGGASGSCSGTPAAGGAGGAGGSGRVTITWIK